MTKIAFRVCIVIFGFVLAIASGQTGLVAQSSGVTPILLVVNDSGSYKWGRYLGEILRAEGISSYDVLNLGDLTASAVAGRNLVILAQTALTGGQANTLTNYVSGGGNLIAMRPASNIISLFGLGAAQGTLNDGYLRIDASASINGNQPGAGLATETLQIHGVTDLYAVGSAVTIAQLYSNATTATANPAVASNSSGSAVAFLYDLASSVILTRQGNPANANVDVDGDGILRTIDLFQTTGGGAPWVDRDKIHIPQADEQQHLFARLVKQAVEKGRPLPQMWYFPDGKLSMLIPTSDAHANPMNYFTSLINSVNAANGVITIYLTAYGGLEIDNVMLNTWIAQGHEFGIHPASDQPATYADLESGYDDVLAFYANRYTTAPSRTVRNHQITWVGWTDAAEIAVAGGMALDTNFYHWGPWLQKPDSSWPHGYITGSGQPMKFIREDGTILPYYQQLTQLVDEQFFPITGGGTGFAGFEGLTAAQGTQVSAELIDASITGDYAAIMTQFHVDYSSFGEVEPWIGGTLNYANSVNIPIWTAGRWLDFVERRFATSYKNITWNDSTNVLTFTTQGPTGSGFTFATMLPAVYNGGDLELVSVDGASVPVYFQTIKGQPVAFVNVAPGNHNFSVAYEKVTIPPTATPPPPEPTADLQVSIQAMPAAVPLGGSLTYLLRVFNAGPDQAANIQLINDVPAGTTFVSAAGPCALDSGTLYCDWDALGAGKLAAAQFTVQVNSGAQVSNTAQVQADQADPVLANNEATRLTPVLPPLNAPTMQSPQVLSLSTVSLNWTNNSAGQTTAFYLERAPIGTQQWQIIAVLPASTLAYVDSSLACAQGYSYRVRAFRQVDQAYSAYSGTVNATTSGCPGPVTDIVGLYRDSVWQFWQTNASGAPAVIFNFGPQDSGWQPITGDWDGDGTDGIGLYKNGTWITRGITAAGLAEAIIRFGPSENGWLPIAGDWNGDGTDGIGLYKNGLFLLRQTASSGPPDLSFTFGPAESGWKPVAGDWDGSGRASIGLYKDGLWLLSNSLPAVPDIAPLAFGPAQPGWLPMTGDWNADGVMSVGVYKDGLWQMRNANTTGTPDLYFSTSSSGGWSPVANYRGSLGMLLALGGTIETGIAPTEISEESTPEVIPTEMLPESTPEVTGEPVVPTLIPAPTLMPTAAPTEAPIPASTTELPEATEEPTAAS